MRSETQLTEHLMAHFITDLSSISGGKKTKVLSPISPDGDHLAYTDEIPTYALKIKKGTSPETVAFIKDTVSIFGRFFGV